MISIESQLDPEGVFRKKQMLKKKNKKKTRPPPTHPVKSTPAPYQSRDDLTEEQEKRIENLLDDANEGEIFKNRFQLEASDAEAIINADK
jgi:hypothetical protein